MQEREWLMAKAGQWWGPKAAGGLAKPACQPGTAQSSMSRQQTLACYGVHSEADVSDLIAWAKEQPDDARSESEDAWPGWLSDSEWSLH